LAAKSQRELQGDEGNYTPLLFVDYGDRGITVFSLGETLSLLEF